MAISRRELDEMEDLRVLMVARAQGPYGIDLARRYANQLVARALAAFGSGDLDEAIWAAKRDCDFNCKFFGFHHLYTKSSMSCIKALRDVEKSQELEAPTLDCYRMAA